MSGETKNVIHNNLPLIVWKPEYDLGIHIIDEQHRGIVTVINCLYYEMQKKKGGSVLTPIFKIIYEYSHIHFTIEEEFLEKSDFPNAITHRALHSELIDTTSKVGKKSILNRDPYQFMDFLKKWWIDHICGEDRVFRDYLLDKAFIEEA